MVFDRMPGRREIIVGQADGRDRGVVRASSPGSEGSVQYGKVQ